MFTIDLLVKFPAFVCQRKTSVLIRDVFHFFKYLKIPVKSPRRFISDLCLFNEINEKVTPDRLKKTYELFTKKYKFKVGDIVKWKPGFNHRKLPRENEPAIVIEVLDNPIIDPTDDVGSPYYNEQYDIKLGIIHPDGRFLTFYYDSARFEPYREE